MTAVITTVTSGVVGIVTIVIIAVRVVTVVRISSSLVIRVIRAVVRVVLTLTVARGWEPVVFRTTIAVVLTHRWRASRQGGPQVKPSTTRQYLRVQAVVMTGRLSRAPVRCHLALMGPRRVVRVTWRHGWDRSRSHHYVGDQTRICTFVVNDVVPPGLIGIQWLRRELLGISIITITTAASFVIRRRFFFDRRFLDRSIQTPLQVSFTVYAVHSNRRVVRQVRGVSVLTSQGPVEQLHAVHEVDGIRNTGTVSEQDECEVLWLTRLTISWPWNFFQWTSLKKIKIIKLKFKQICYSFFIIKHIRYTFQWQYTIAREYAFIYSPSVLSLIILWLLSIFGKGKGKVFYGHEPSSGESTTTECGVNYQILAVIYSSSPMRNS